MKKITQELDWFLHQKIYVFLLALTAVCGYGFEITHYSIGIDDTARSLYLTDGLEVVMGRWTLFLVNKVFHFAEFSPFLLEFVGVLLLMIGVTLFCVLLRRLLGEQIGIAGYTIFACIFLSNPIMAEVYYYYCHNGADLAYILTALSLLFFLESLDQHGKGKLLCLFKSFLLVWLASGCYESFFVLYIIGVLMILYVRGMTGRDQLGLVYMIKNLAIMAGTLVLCVILRSLIIMLLTNVFRLQDMQLIAGQRSITVGLPLFDGREGLSNLFMHLKRHWLIYYLNAVVYLPVTGYVFAVAVIGILSVGLLWKKKNGWYLVLYVGVHFAPALLTIIEAWVTRYRSSQYLPFVNALGCIVLYLWAVRRKNGKFWVTVVCFVACVLVFRQASDMNTYFYKDYLKYQDARETILEIAYDVEKEYGKDTPVIFVGNHYTPHELAADYYVSYDSWQYRVISAIAGLVDEHLVEKYHTPYGYHFGGEGIMSVIDWGVEAFDGTNRELIRFLEMHGHSFLFVTDRQVMSEATEMGYSMPSWPDEGSIIDWNGYILVHIDS